MLESLKLGFRKIAENPRLKVPAMGELVHSIPDILEAFLNLVEVEHKGVVIEVVNAAISAYKRE